MGHPRDDEFFLAKLGEERYNKGKVPGSWQKKEMTVMEALSRCEVCTDHGRKLVEVYHADVCKFAEPIDILTTSAFRGSYIPMEGTVFHALDRRGISVQTLAKAPMIDLAFQRLPDGITFKLFRVDPTPFPASFRYYLSRQNWVEAYLPPMEERLEEFADYVADPKM
jgi:hypothetical protein